MEISIHQNFPVMEIFFLWWVEFHDALYFWYRIYNYIATHLSASNGVKLKFSFPINDIEWKSRYDDDKVY